MDSFTRWSRSALDEFSARVASVRTCDAFRASRLTPLLQQLVLTAALAACSHDANAPGAEVLGARLAGDASPVLETEVDLRFSPTMLEALDRGIPLRLRFELAGERGATRLSAQRELQLRYVPLARRYQVLDLQTGSSRSFPRRPQLLAALDRVRLPLAPEWAALRDGGTLALDLKLDQAALPGPLRLPALLSAEWRLTAKEFAWRSDG